MRGLLMWLLLPVSATAGAGDPSPADTTRPADARLSVGRAIGAEMCPDRATLERRIFDISGHRWSRDSGADALAIEVRFERTSDGGFAARVAATGPKAGQRSLRDANPTCDALAEAVSVAIALLLDSAPAVPREPAPSTSTPRARTEANRDVTTTPNGARPLRTRASLEAGAGYGLGGAGAFLAGGRLGLRHGTWLFDLGAFGSLPTDASFERGAVRTSLSFGSARVCYLLGQRWTVAPCVQLAAGRLRGEGRGYGRALSSSLPWVAAGLGLSGEAPLGERLYATWGATLWIPTRRQTFSVQNAGIAWESKPIAGLVTAGLGFSMF